MKKILFISRLYYPHVGGVEKHISEVCKILTERGYEVVLLVEKHGREIKYREVIGGIEINRITYPNVRFIGLIIIWLRLIRYIPLVLSSNIVHIHDVFLWYLPFRIFLPFKKVYVTFHGYSEYPLRRITIFQKRITNLMISGGLGIGKFIEKWYGLKLKSISYGAVDLKDFKPRKVKRIYDAVFSSRLSNQTGIVEYLKAVKLLKTKHEVDIKVVVLGDGKYRKDADALMETKGFVMNVIPYFNKSKTAFVNRYLAILEAFANKKLVIATYDNELKKDYLLMTPFKDWIVVEKDPEKLAEKIKYYLDHPEKAKPMIEAAYKWVQGQTWEKMADTYEELWGMKEKTV